MLPVLKRDFGEYERGKVKCYFKHKKATARVAFLNANSLKTQ